MTWKIPLFKIYWDNGDIENVAEAVKTGMRWAVGPYIEKFEEKIAEYIGSKHAVVFNSGTSALHAVLVSHGVKRGDKVIVPSFTFIATANAPLFVGAKPVFADIEKRTFGLDPEDVKEKITRKTRAIIPIHYGGCPCLIRELKEIAEDHHVLLVEDAAESFGARVYDKKVGTFGDSAMLSFCQNKIITTGDGGAIVTDSKDVYEKLKLVRSHGRLETRDYFSSIEYLDYITLGYNFRMSNIIAALGISQLKKVDKVIDMRRKNAKYMSEKLKNVKEVTTTSAPMHYYHVYQMYTIRVSSSIRDYLMKYLADKGIMTKVYFSPVHLTHYYKNELKYECKLPVTEKMSNQILSLPIYPTLTRKEIVYMIDQIKSFFELIR
jgi:perosamine synthetase